ncbi:hypothetical protein BGZ60DRAFT_283460 [Tricladium varicosporioides]|nr:hypothetical protein BGZ60DRAFT_283460 [Hymenoscyphus varicosporioides]
MQLQAFLLAVLCSRYSASQHRNAASTLRIGAASVVQLLYVHFAFAEPSSSVILLQSPGGRGVVVQTDFYLNCSVRDRGYLWKIMLPLLPDALFGCHRP